MNAEKLRRSGNAQGAIDLCRDALVRFPGHLSARVTLGWAMLDLGRLKEAREEFETVRRSAPDNFAAIRGLAQLHVLEENESEGYSFEAEVEPEASNTAAELSPVRQAPDDKAVRASSVVARLEMWLSKVEALRAAAV